jgi:hypothetical protein
MAYVDARIYTSSPHIPVEKTHCTSSEIGDSAPCVSRGPFDSPSSSTRPWLWSRPRALIWLTRPLYMTRCYELQIKRGKKAILRARRTRPSTLGDDCEWLISAIEDP